MRILVTGGAGFIGSHVAEELARGGCEPVVFDNLGTGKRENLAGISHTFIEGDVRDIGALRKAMKGCASVFHLSALTSVVESMDAPEEYIDVNLRGTLNVLKAARENAVAKVVFSSSAAIYGDSPVLPKTEEMRPEPKSPYAIAKLDSEYYCTLYRESHSLPTVCARFFNVFGERQDPASPYAAAVPLFISKAFNNSPIDIHGDGRQTRDFVYVRDIVKALIFLMEKEVGIFNIGYGKTIEINRLAGVIRNLLHSGSAIVHTPERREEIRHSFASVEKLLMRGFRFDYTLETGLMRTIRWFRDAGR